LNSLDNWVSDEFGIELPFFRCGSPECRYFRLSLYSV